MSSWIAVSLHAVIIMSGLLPNPSLTVAVTGSCIYLTGNSLPSVPLGWQLTCIACSPGADKACFGCLAIMLRCELLAST